MTQTHEVAATLGIGDVARLSEEDYERVVLDNVFRHKRNEETWGNLMSEEQVFRTRDALRTVLDHHLAAVRRRNADWLERRSSEVIEDYGAALAAYKQRNRRDATFSGIIERALGEATTAARQYNVTSSNSEERDNNRVYRRVIGELVNAIQHHRDTNTAAGVIPEAADEELWAVLVTVRQRLNELEGRA